MYFLQDVWCDARLATNIKMLSLLHFWYLGWANACNFACNYWIVAIPANYSPPDNLKWWAPCASVYLIINSYQKHRHPLLLWFCWKPMWSQGWFQVLHTVARTLTTDRFILWEQKRWGMCDHDHCFNNSYCRWDSEVWKLMLHLNK